MSSTLKTVATETVKKSFTPSRTFFRLSETIPSIQHARAVFKTLGSYGEMVEYKVMRVSATRKKKEEKETDDKKVVPWDTEIFTLWICGVQE